MAGYLCQALAQPSDTVGISVVVLPWGIVVAKALRISSAIPGQGKLARPIAGTSKVSASAPGHQFGAA